MINSKFKLKKLFTLWVQVFAYSFVSYIIAVAVFDKTFNLKDCIYSFMPIINQKFWFISAYFLLYLISPFLNNMLKNSSQKQLKYLMIGILIFVYITSRFNIKDVASLAKGYSFIWFIILYIVGAYFKLNPPTLNKLKILAIYIPCIFATWAMFAYPQDGKLSFLYMCDTNYNSPLVLVASVCIFLMFRDIYIKNVTVHRIICFFSSCMFGIYLFQESYIKHNIYFDIIKVSNYYSSAVPAWLNVLYLAFLIFVFGLAVEMVRKGIVKLLNLIYKKVRNI